ncbi:enolase C-terminal domain-like protein [Streptomyces sp. NPDC038707]|uniref:mandelate racemase/muconate lactonizing enzyme family protein n=1 Tax=Streptomyces sp. NPDC038707 TaxID=3154329 RepID=UPI0033C8D229
MDEARVHHVRLPMRYGFDHPAKRRRTSESLLLRLTVDGVSGHGECAPRSYVTGETCASVLARLRDVPLDGLYGTLRAEPADQVLAALRRDGFTGTFGIDGGSNLVCLLELAVVDWLGQRLGLGARQLLAPAAGEGPPALRISQVLDLGTTVEEFLDSRGPFHFVKVKASDDIERDVATVGRLRAALPAGVPVMVDANMSWHPDRAADHVRRLTDAGVTWFEEPLAKGALDDLRELRLATGARIMLDESVCSLADAEAAEAADACDAFNIRVSKCGGLFASMDIARFARSHGIAYQVGVQVAETGPLIAAGRHLAFCLPDALTVESGQSDRYFPEPVVTPMPAVDRRANTIAPPPGTGLGTALNESAGNWAVLAHRAGPAGWQESPAAREKAGRP